MGGHGERLKVDDEEEAGEKSEPEEPEGLSVLKGSSSRSPKPELLKEEEDEGPSRLGPLSIWFNEAMYFIANRRVVIFVSFSHVFP